LLLRFDGCQYNAGSGCIFFLKNAVLGLWDTNPNPNPKTAFF